jgi:hypothetical protein
MRIAFVRCANGGVVSRLARPDGVLVEMRGYSRKHAVPHDLAHAVTERELGMDRGVYGSVAAGALFASVRVIGGRSRYDAAARSERILRANRAAIGVAEVLSGIVHHAVQAGGPVPVRAAREGWGVCSAEPFPWTRDDLARASGTLRAVAGQWAALAVGETLELDWPLRLVSRIPAPVRVNDRSRVRRR